LTVHSIKYSGSKDGWVREETQVEQNVFARYLTDTWFDFLGKLSDSEALTIPISNPEDLPDHMKGFVVSILRRPSVSEAESFRNVKSNSELWKRAVEIADKIPFNEWVIYASQLTPECFIFWSNVLRCTRSQNTEEPDAQNHL
jgi:hypothetical protein